jgi:hypothetical protein
MSLSYLGLLAKLIPFASSFDDIIEAIGAFQTAEGSKAYWEAFKRLGDLLQPPIEAVTGFEVLSETHAVEALKLGDGKLLERFKQFYNSAAGQMLLQILLGQLGK